jgi:hypothetical protein
MVPIAWVPTACWTLWYLAGHAPTALVRLIVCLLEVLLHLIEAAAVVQPLATALQVELKPASGCRVDGSEDYQFVVRLCSASC